MSGSTLKARSPSAERASSVGSKSSRKDNRPLGEKWFQTDMLGKIDSYIRSIQQTSLLNTNASVKPITLKMFIEVSDLLVKLLDVKHGLTSANYVEELPKIAKKLHYPGPMNKSWLKTANAPHAWPQVLGWLSWLAETCHAKDLALDYYQLENLPFIEIEDGGNLNRIKFHFLLDGYKAWNEEKPNEEAGYTEDYLARVANAQGVSEADIETAMAESESEYLKLEDAKEKGQKFDDEIRKLDETLRSLRNEDARQDTYVKELENSEKKYLIEADQIEKETKILQETLQQQKLRQEELKMETNSQPMSVVERDEIIERCAVIQTQMRDLDSHLNDLEKEIYTLDIKLASVRNNLNKVVFAYNKDIYLHFDKEAEIDWDDIAMPITGISNPDIMDELERKSNLMAVLHENIEKHVKIAESEIEADEKKLKGLEAEIVALEQQKEDKFLKVNENRNRIKKIEDSAKVEESELKETIECLKTKINDILNKMPNTEEESKELSEAREKVEALQKRKAYLEESGHLFFDKFFEILANHRNKLARILEDSIEPAE